MNEASGHGQSLALTAKIIHRIVPPREGMSVEPALSALQERTHCGRLVRTCGDAQPRHKQPHIQQLAAGAQRDEQHAEQRIVELTDDDKQRDSTVVQLAWTRRP